MDEPARQQLIGRATAGRLRLHLSRALLQSRVADAREAREDAAALRRQARQIVRTMHRRRDH
jgi:hypothetical protein